MSVRCVGILALLALATAGTACSERKTLPEANLDVVAAELAERLPAIGRCWTAGDKRGSHMPGDRQLLRITVLPTGKVKTAFADMAHNKHPVGSCVRSAFDGLRFAPRDDEAVIEIPLELGASVDEPKAGPPTASQASAAAP